MSIKEFCMQMMWFCFYIKSLVVLNKIIGVTSGYKINEQKSILMDLGLLRQQRDFVAVRPNGNRDMIFGDKNYFNIWHKYLLDNNTILLINWTQSRLDKWTSFQFSCMDRIAVVKMKILPKLFLLFQNLIVFIRQNSLDKI